MMEKVNALLHNDSFIKHEKKIERYEEGRGFCKHDINHCLDVARIMMILNHERAVAIPKNIIYATALLHDIGRDVQYAEGIPHEEAGVEIARAILLECGFSEEDSKWVTIAIGNHRNPVIKNEKNLNGILYSADKLSRNCYICPAEQHCDWKKEKKNMKLEY